MAAAAADTDFSYLAAPWAPLPVGLPLEQLMTPSGIPPNGAPDFINPPSLQTTILAVCSVMIGLTVIFVALRLYSVLRITQSMGKEDYVCLIATVLSFGYAAFIMYLAHAARHMYDVPFWWFNDTYWKERYAENTIQTFAFPMTRTTFFLLYIRVFGNNNRTFRYLCYLGIVAYSISYLLFIPLNAVYCAPKPGADWAGAGVLQKCEALEPFSFFLGAANIVGDLYIIILPLPIISRLHMTTEKKLGVMAIFLTGIFVLIASAISMYFRYRLVYGGDTNWYEGSLVCATVSELCVAIIASCMPSLSSLFKAHFKDSTFFSSFRSMFRSTGTKGLSSPSSGSTGTKPHRFALWKGYKNSDLEKSYPSAGTQGSESQSHLRDQKYVELNEWEATKPEVASYVYGPAAEDGMGGKSKKGGRDGIMKSVDININDAGAKPNRRS